MTYNLAFIPSSEGEWDQLDGSIKRQFKKALKKRLKEPRPPGAKLHGHDDLYKIKLRRYGYRLIYQVVDETLIVKVIAVGRRDKSAVYQIMNERLKDLEEQETIVPERKDSP
ncbi:MAG: type II toxin-antitoxin system RelE/ParE family toxin [Rhodobiaceae bacterium]|jgi:mRNA interferase RelE/StbE|nr:type II toxin-antitoxin system RelE/ParE family toxin [Rhodobiaceae bacterium]